MQVKIALDEKVPETPEEARAAIAALRLDGDFMTAYTNGGHVGHASAARLMKNLYEAANPEPELPEEKPSETPEKAREELARLNKDKDFVNSLTDRRRPDHKASVRKRFNLYRAANAGKPDQYDQV